MGRNSIKKIQSKTGNDCYFEKNSTGKESHSEGNLSFLSACATRRHIIEAPFVTLLHFFFQLWIALLWLVNPLKIVVLFVLPLNSKGHFGVTIIGSLQVVGYYNAGELGA